MDERELVETGDGSHSLYLPALNEQYHSRHGAVNESRHVFIKMGLRAVMPFEYPLQVLEIGFGTGLNALLTMEALHGPLSYTTVEAYPVRWSEAQMLNYPQWVHHRYAQQWFQWLHLSPWELKLQAPGLPFELQKLQADFHNFYTEKIFDLVYFDAFAPDKQPELWTDRMFGRLSQMMRPGGILVTYSAKGAVRRTMQSMGFRVERLPGPPGKREMLRATKT